MIFNASERKGVIVLLLLLTVLVIFPKQFLPEDSGLFLLPVEAEICEDSLFLFSSSEMRIIPLKQHKRSSPASLVELNTADSIALLKIRGIGPYYASKIIRYRERLGGYYSLKQLKELKMTYFDADSAVCFFCVDTTFIVKRDLDSLDFRAVLKHPYLEYEDVKMIFKAKQKYCRLSYQLLEEKGVLPDYRLKKIKPYFK